MVPGITKGFPLAKPRTVRVPQRIMTTLMQTHLMYKNPLIQNEQQKRKTPHFPFPGQKECIGHYLK